jgi:hypothetical protein
VAPPVIDLERIVDAVPDDERGDEPSTVNRADRNWLKMGINQAHENTRVGNIIVVDVIVDKAAKVCMYWTKARERGFLVYLGTVDRLVSKPPKELEMITYYVRTFPRVYQIIVIVVIKSILE